MKKVTTILADYRNADFEERLHLFLDCRELREEFTKIEQEGAVNRAVQKLKPGVIAEIKEKLLDWFPASLQAKIRRCCSPQ